MSLTSLEIGKSQKAIKELSYKNSVGQKLINLKNYALDFESSFVLLGFTKKGDKAILGVSESSSPDGERVFKKVYGTIYKRESGRREGSVTEFRISAEGHRYSKTLFEVRS